MSDAAKRVCTAALEALAEQEGVKLYGADEDGTFDPAKVGVDGYVDLVDLVEAILKATAAEQMREGPSRR